MLVGESGAVAPYGIGYGLDGLVLTHDPLVEFALHPQKFFLLAFQHSIDRNAGPTGHNLGDVLWGDRLGDDRILDGCLLGAEFLHLLLGFGHLAIADLRHLAIVTGPLGYSRVALVVLDVLAEVVELCDDAFLLVPALGEGIPVLLAFLQFLVKLL